MEIDPNNPVVRLCAAGVAAEMQGRLDEATRLYREAWEARQDDYEACIVSHYLARVQRTPNEVLAWNQESLRYADAVKTRECRHFSLALSEHGEGSRGLGQPGRSQEVLLDG